MDLKWCFWVLFASNSLVFSINDPSAFGRRRGNPCHRKVMRKASGERPSMKDGIHPEYREVVYQDTSCGFSFITRSTARTSDTIRWEDGNEYPLVKVEISSASHPFFTGKEKLVDTEGRVERFKNKYARPAKKKGRPSWEKSWSSTLQLERDIVTTQQKIRRRLRRS